MAESLLASLIRCRNRAAGLIAYVHGNQPVLAVRKLRPYRHGTPSVRSFGGVPGRSPVQTRSPVRILRYAEPPRPSFLWHGFLLVSASSRHSQSRSARGSYGVSRFCSVSACPATQLWDGCGLSALRGRSVAVVIAMHRPDSIDDQRSTDLWIHHL